MVDAQPGNALVSAATDAGAAVCAFEPCGSHPGSRWFCAWTHPGGEFRAELDLMGKGFETYLPLTLEREVISPLFPRYIFSRFHTGRDQWRRIYRSRGIAGLIGTTTDKPTPVPAGFVEGLIARTSARRVVDDPTAEPPADLFPVDAVGRVTEGFWAGRQGVCTMSRRARVELLLTVMGGERRVEFPRQMVAAA